MITIVVPACNEEGYIISCLESLKNQDYSGAFEVIVVDNNSQDNTARIARDMGAVLVFCPWKGVSLARQAGAEAARGDIIVQADADTVYPPNWLSRIRRQFDSHPGAVAVAGTFTYRSPPWWAIFEYLLRVVFGWLSALFFGKPYIVSGANFAFYKESFVKIGGYHPAAYSSDQIDICRRLSCLGKVVLDTKLSCLTSERSVAKPAVVLISDFLNHISTFMQHLLKGSRTSVRVQAAKYLHHSRVP